MIISLYYVEGISVVDTPYFSCLNEQNLYFAKKLVKQVDNTFYPPYFKNSIKFSSDDLTINDKINYLSFVFQNKTYYYFVNKIEYVSENIIELNCTLDSIQTFMFNIYTSSGIINRKFIDRYLADNSINRSYMRENISDGLFKNCIYHEYPDRGIYIVKSASFLGNGQYSLDYEKGFTQDNKVFSSLNYYIFPSDTVSVTDESVLYGNGVSYYTGDGVTTNPCTVHKINEPMYTPAMISNCSKCVGTYDIYYIPFIPIYGLEYYDANVTYPYDVIGGKEPHESTVKSHVLSFESKYLYRDDGTYYPNPNVSITSYRPPFYDSNSLVDTQTCIIFSVSNCKTRYYNDMYTFTVNDNSFTINKKADVPFSSRYVPTLIDENFINIQYGERSVSTTYPISRLSYPIVHLFHWADICSGDRFYSITDSNLNDNYLTTCVATKPISFDLTTDYYQEYVSRNKFTMLASVGQDVSKVISNVTDIAIPTKFAYKTILSNKDTLSDYKRDNLLKKVDNNAIVDSINDASRFNSSVVNEMITRANLKYVPDSVKNTGNFSSDSLCKSYTRCLRISMVEDIEQVAQYFHRNGYLVNEYVSNVSNIFSYVNTRYYFNVLFMSNSDIHLNILESNDIVSSINNRLEKGIRLWNVDDYSNNSITLRSYSIGDFTYDNVEKDYLS